MSINQWFAYAFGAVYVLIGVVGFAVTGDVGFAHHDGALLLGIFEVNPLHNIVHLAIGAAFIAGAAGGLRSARAVNLGIGAVYLLVGLLGFVVPRDEPVNLLALNMADNWLHIFSGAAALAVGSLADKARDGRR